jgi:hypothetical protein
MKMNIREHTETRKMFMISVANLDRGSGIRCLYDPWIRDTGWVKYQDPDPGSGMNNPDHMSESL